MSSILTPNTLGIGIAIVVGTAIAKALGFFNVAATPKSGRFQRVGASAAIGFEMAVWAVAVWFLFNLQKTRLVTSRDLGTLLGADEIAILWLFIILFGALWLTGLIGFIRATMKCFRGGGEADGARKSADIARKS